MRLSYGIIFLSIGLVFAKSRSVTRQSTVDTQSTIDTIKEVTNQMVKMSGFISTIVSSENATAELDQVFAEAQTLSGDLLAQKNILSLAADPSAGTKVFDHNSEATAGLKVVLSIIEQELQTVARNVDSVTVQFPILTGQWNITEVPDVICLVQDAIEKQGIPGGDVELFTLHSETFAVSAKGPNSNGIPLLQSHVTITVGNNVPAPTKI